MIEQIGVVITAVSGLVLTVGQIMSNRQKKTILDADQLQTDLDARTRQYQVAMRHIARLENILAGLPVDTHIPARPEELAAGWAPDDDGNGKRR